MIVSPDGVKSIRTRDGGTVHQMQPGPNGQFEPGNIICVVMPTDAAARNAFAQQVYQATLLEVATKQGEKLITLSRRIARAEAERHALSSRLASARIRLELVSALESEIHHYRNLTRAQLDKLAQERLGEIEELQKLLEESGHRGAMPEQRRLQLMQQVYSDRTSTLSGNARGYSTDQQRLTLVKEIEDISYRIRIDEAEQEILSREVDDLRTQSRQTEELRDKMIEEAKTRLLSTLKLPEVSYAAGLTDDLRLIQGNRTTVARGDVLRIVEQRDVAPGLYLLTHGAAASIKLHLATPEKRQSLELTRPFHDIVAEFATLGLDVGNIRRNRWEGQEAQVFSLYLPLQFGSGALTDSFEISAIEAQTQEGVPVPVEFSLLSAPQGAANDRTVILGFVENSHALVVNPGQPVVASMRDPRNGFATVIHGNVHAVAQSTIDATELALRLGNREFARQALSDTLLSQVSIAIDPRDAAAFDDARGAVIQLAFPIRSASIFRYLSSTHVE